MHVLDFQHFDAGETGSPDAVLSLLSAQCRSSVSLMLCPPSGFHAVGGQEAGEQD
jgi:hypothetical protein